MTPIGAHAASRVEAVGSRSYGRRRTTPALVAYVTVLTATAFVAARGALDAAVILAGLTTLALANHAAVLSRPSRPLLLESGGAPPQPLLLTALAVLPIAALAGAAASLRPVPAAAQPALVAVVLGVGVAAVARAFRLRPAELGMRPARWRPQALIALSGFPLGVVAFLVLGRDPFDALGAADRLPVTAVVTVAVAGMAGELFFRGLLAGAFLKAIKGRGILWSSVVFALPAVTSDSLGLVLVFVATGMLWGWAYARTGSIIGTALAHAAAAVGFIVIWPAVLG